MDIQKIYEISMEISEKTRDFLMGETNIKYLSCDIDKFVSLASASVGILFHNLKYISEKKGISASELYSCIDVEGTIKEFEKYN